MSNPKAPNFARLSADRRQLFRAFLTMDEEDGLITSDEYFLFDEAFSFDAVYTVRPCPCINPNLGSYAALFIGVEGAATRLPYFVDVAELIPL